MSCFITLWTKAPLRALYWPADRGLPFSRPLFIRAACTSHWRPRVRCSLYGPEGLGVCVDIKMWRHPTSLKKLGRSPFWTARTFWRLRKAMPPESEERDKKIPAVKFPVHFPTVSQQYVAWNRGKATGSAPSVPHRKHVTSPLHGTTSECWTHAVSEC
jgi:hypothetical protein